MGELRRSGRFTPSLRPGIGTGNGGDTGTRDHRLVRPARATTPATKDLSTEVG
ncbi:hypothetical protein GCM10028793_45640 [Nocardiopsis oceani]